MFARHTGTSQGNFGGHPLCPSILGSRNRSLTRAGSDGSGDWHLEITAVVDEN